MTEPIEPFGDGPTVESCRHRHSVESGEISPDRQSIRDRSFALAVCVGSPLFSERNEEEPSQSAIVKWCIHNGLRLRLFPEGARKNDERNLLGQAPPRRSSIDHGRPSRSLEDLLKHRDQNVDGGADVDIFLVRHLFHS